MDFETAVFVTGPNVLSITTERDGGNFGRMFGIRPLVGPRQRIASKYSVSVAVTLLSGDILGYRSPARCFVRYTGISAVYSPVAIPLFKSRFTIFCDLSKPNVFFVRGRV
jgi:hypothetical protein